MALFTYAERTLWFTAWDGISWMLEHKLFVARQETGDLPEAFYRAPGKGFFC
jgi:hypothetical protein